VSTSTDAQRRRLDDHGAAELRFDVDGVMATVDDDCTYEWHPVGRVLRGRAACRRMYEVFLPRWQELERSAGLRFEVRSEAWSEQGRIREQVAFVYDGTGGETRHDFVVMVEFGERGVRAERTYASTELHRLFLGDHFDDLDAIAGRGW
jgi:hypothetical protein